MDIRYRDASGEKVLRIPQWAIAIFAVLGIALGLAVIVVGAGLFLLVVPLLVVAGLIARWRLRKILREAEKAARERSGASPIEVEYTIVEQRSEIRKPGER
jgi:hypothetical protein